MQTKPIVELRFVARSKKMKIQMKEEVSNYVAFCNYQF